MLADVEDLGEMSWQNRELHDLSSESCRTETLKEKRWKEEKKKCPKKWTNDFFGTSMVPDQREQKQLVRFCKVGRANKYRINLWLWHEESWTLCQTVFVFVRLNCLATTFNRITFEVHYHVYSYTGIHGNSFVPSTHLSKLWRSIHHLCRFLQWSEGLCSDVKAQATKLNACNDCSLWKGTLASMATGKERNSLQG